MTIFAERVVDLNLQAMARAIEQNIFYFDAKVREEKVGFSGDVMDIPKSWQPLKFTFQTEKGNISVGTCISRFCTGNGLLYAEANTSVEYNGKELRYSSAINSGYLEHFATEYDSNGDAHFSLAKLLLKVESENKDFSLPQELKEAIDKHINSLPQLSQIEVNELIRDKKEQWDNDKSLEKWVKGGVVNLEFYKEELDKLAFNRYENKKQLEEDISNIQFGMNMDINYGELPEEANEQEQNAQTEKQNSPKSKRKVG